MKANEFVKKFGLEKTSAELNVFQSELAVNLVRCWEVGCE